MIGASVVALKVGQTRKNGNSRNWVKVVRYARGAQADCLRKYHERIYHNISKASMRRVLHAQWKFYTAPEVERFVTVNGEITKFKAQNG